MKNYFKVLFLTLFVVACSPEELEFIGTLTTKVEPAQSGSIAQISQTNSNIIQM